MDINYTVVKVIKPIKFLRYFLAYKMIKFKDVKDKEILQKKRNRMKKKLAKSL